MTDKNEGLGPVVEKYLRQFYAKAKSPIAPVNVYDCVMSEVEKRLISVTLDVTNGNRLKAAKILGINRNTLLRKIRELDLDDKRGVE